MLIVQQHISISLKLANCTFCELFDYSIARNIHESSNMKIILSNLRWTWFKKRNLLKPNEPNESQLIRLYNWI